MLFFKSVVQSIELNRLLDEAAKMLDEAIGLVQECASAMTSR